MMVNIGWLAGLNSLQQPGVLDKHARTEVFAAS